VQAPGEERRFASPVESTRPNPEWTMTGDLILRLATFAFMIGVFVYAFLINL
jgi:hypothetical protein